MTRKIFSAAASLACFVLILGALLTTLGMQLLGDLKTYVQVSLKNVEAATGCRITVDDIGWDIFAGTGIRIHNLVIYDADKKTPLFDSRKAHIRFNVLPLLQSRLVVSSISLDRPRMRLQRDAAGSWLLPLPQAALPAGVKPDIEAFADFSISLKRLKVINGTITFEDRQRGLHLEVQQVMMGLERQDGRPAFNIELAAREAGGQGGEIVFTGTVQGFDDRGLPEHLSGTGELTIAAARLPDLAGAVPSAAPADATRFSAQLSVQLEPDWRFALSGFVASDDLHVPLAAGSPPLQLGPCRLDGTARVSGDGLQFDHFTFFVGDAAALTGAGSLAATAQGDMELDLTCSSNRIPVALAARIAAAAPGIPEPVRPVIAGAAGGDIVISGARIRACLRKGPDRPAPRITAAAELRDVTLRLLPALPPATIARAQLSFREDETLQASAALRWPGADNHTLEVSIASAFHEPRLQAHMVSDLSAAGAQAVIDALVTGPGTRGVLSFPSGRIAANTRISGRPPVSLAADIDLTHAAVAAAGMVEKAEGMPLHVRVTKNAATGKPAPATPLSFTVTSGRAAKISGALTGVSPLSARGTYDIQQLDLSAFCLPAVQKLLTMSGFLSGRGAWRIPAAAPDHFSTQGSCSLRDFTLSGAASGRRLIAASVKGAFDGAAFKIADCRAALGQTYGTITGRLTSLVPTRGRLVIDGDLFDIDDFVSVIDELIDISRLSQTAAGPAADQTPQKQPEPSLLHRTDLVMPLKLKRLNLWNWDMVNGTCLWTIKNGVMNFSDITFTAGGGPLSGEVMFDMSKLPERTLRLSPAKTQADFLFVVPALRKKRIITGTMDMSGYFSSTFSRKEDLGRNMGGRVHITMTDGKLQKLTVLSKIMELMNLRHFFDFTARDLLSKGMPYDRITADFTVDHAVMKTDNLQLKGPAMNLSAVGTINMLTEDLDLIIGAQVLETFGKIVGAIPIAGSIVTGRDKTITLAYFKVAGSYQEAAVKPMAVKSLSAPLMKIMDSLLYFPKKLLSPSAAADNDTAAAPR